MRGIVTFDFVYRSVSAPDITCNNKTFKVQTVVDTVLHNKNSTLPPGNSGKMLVYFDTKWWSGTAISDQWDRMKRALLKISFLRLNDKMIFLFRGNTICRPALL